MQSSFRFSPITKKSILNVHFINFPTYICQAEKHYVTPLFLVG